MRQSGEDMNDQDVRLGLLRTFLVTNLGIIVAMFWFYTEHVRPYVSRKRKRGKRYVMLGKLRLQRSYMKRLTQMSDIDCKNSLRMDMNCFNQFCKLLRDRGGLKDSKWVSLEEKVATFLAVIGHHTKQRVAMFAWRRSGHTISLYVNEVLRCVLKLHYLLIAPVVPIPSDCDVEPWCHFKGCLGALDGTYIEITCPRNLQKNYHNRKGYLSFNVLGVCDKDMKFIYVLSGWEGSAADGRVLRDALNRSEGGFSVPRGHYYLVDAGYMNAPGFLPPFRKTRYHLKEWAESRMQPQTPKEYFNLKHSSARNVIERAWGLLKKRFGILRSPSGYPLDTQNDIILACCLIHNYLHVIASDDLLQDESDPNFDPLRILDDEDAANIAADQQFPIDVLRKCTQWKKYRRDLAEKMFKWWKQRHAVRN